MYNSASHSPKTFAVIFLTCMLWGLVLQFMSGYFFLHSWNNLFGELLRFADREFYSVSVTSYYFFILQWIYTSSTLFRTGGRAHLSLSSIASGISLFMTGLRHTFTRTLKM